MKITTETEMDPLVVIRAGILSMQVCCLREMEDDEVERLANLQNPCGTQHGWSIRKQGDPDLAGRAERVTCGDDPRRVHIMLDV